MGLPEDDVEEIDPGAGPRPDPRPRARRDRGRPGPASRARHHRAGAAAARRRRARRDAAPIVLDAEALRSLATIDELVGGRPPPGGPDPARRRVRPPASRQRSRARRRRRPRRRRRRAGRGRQGCRGDLERRRRAQGRPDRDRGGRRHRGRRPVREPGARLGRHRRRPVGSDRVAARPGARAVRRGPARRLPPRRGRRRDPRAVRRRRVARVGPARRAGDRPQAPRRPGRAQGRAASASGSAPANGSLRRGRPRPDPPPPGSIAPVEPRGARRDRSVVATTGDRVAPRRRPGCRRCRGRPGSSSTSTPCAATSPGSRRLAGPGVPVRPVVKADAYGHGAVPIALALEAAGVDGLCVAAFDEALELRDGGVRGPILVLYPIPAAWAAEAARQRDRGHGRRRRPPRRPLAAAVARRTVDRPLEVELEVETGLGRGGFAGEALVDAARMIDGRPGLRLSGLWTHLQAVEDAELTARQVERFEAGDRRRRGRRDRPPDPACRGQRGGDRRRRRHVRRDPSGPGRLRPRPGRAPTRPDRGRSRGRSAAGHVAVRAAGPRRRTCPPGGGSATVRRSAPRGPAGSPRSRSGYGDGWSRRLSNRAAAIVRGVRVPLVGNVAMDAVMADVTDVPGPAGRRGRRIRAHRRGRGRADHRRRSGARAHHEPLGGGHRHGSPPTPGVPCGGRTGRSASAHRAENLVARIEIWNGDICDLEVDAIVTPAIGSLWMSTGVAGAIKRAGGDAIEFAAIRQAPVELGQADRDAGRDARRQGRHPRRLARSRPADQRRDARGRGAQRDGPRPRDRRDQHRLPGARLRCRRLPARGGRPDHRRRPFATS